MIYLDHASTTPPLSVAGGAVDAIREFAWGNPHSIHKIGTSAQAVLSDAEEIICKSINGMNGRIIWTMNGTQANQLAIQTICKNDRAALVTSTIEHKSIEELWRSYGSAVDPDAGYVWSTKVSKYLTKWTKLVSIIAVNNETGRTNNIQKISKVVKEFNPQILMHTDAVQAFGKIPLDVESWGIDLLTLSAHKIYGPKGIGCLWIRDGVEFQPLYQGTPAPDLAAGFAEAVREATDPIKLQEYSTLLSNQMAEFGFRLNDTGVYFHVNSMANGIMSLRFNVDADELVLALDDKHIAVSLGSACNNKQRDLRVLMNSGLTEQEARQTIRLSFGRAVNLDEIEIAAKIIAETVKELE